MTSRLARALGCSLWLNLVVLAGPLWAQAGAPSNDPGAAANAKNAAGAPGVTAPPPAPPAPPGAIELLLRNARYWQARGREDRAAEAYEKVLRSDPRNVEALSALGGQAARLGNLEKARALLAKLKELAPGSADARMVERAIAVGDEADRMLAQARALAKDGKADEAIAVYRKLFGDAPPPRHLALEFFATLGGAKDGWKEAKDGLDELMKLNPGEPLYLLAQARVATYREETRRAGIQALQKMIDDGQLADEADASMKQALLWLRVFSSDEPLLRAYLARHPEDAEIKKRIAEPHPDLQREGTVAAGYDALQRSDVKEADRLFKSASRADQSVDTLVGQGVVAMRQQEFVKAKEIFTKVKQLAPGKPELWERSLRAAMFWALMQEAKSAEANHRDDEAAGLLGQAFAMGGDARPYAEVALARLAISRGRLDDAEQRLRALVRERPDMPEALAALIELLVKTDQSEEAQAINEHLAKISPESAVAPRRLEAELLRTRAKGLLAQGRYDLALQALTAARASDAADRWVLHDLANLELEIGDSSAAREATAALLKLDPEMIEAQVTWLRVLADAGDDDAALAALAALPPEALTQEVRAYKPLLEVRSEAGRIVRRASRERREVVRDELLRLQQKVRGQPQAAAAVARAWVAIGDSQRAVDLMNEVVSANPNAPVGLKLDLAVVLMQTSQDAPLLALFSELDADPRLTPRERRGLTSLKVAVTARRADRFREAHDLVQAFNTLAGAINDLPEEPGLLAALGRLFLDGDRPEDAMAIFAQLLDKNPDNLEAREGAVRSAARLRRLGEARKLVGQGIERSPQDPGMRLLAARLEVELGSDGAAMSELEEAQKLAAVQLPADSTAHGAPISETSSVGEILSEGRHAFAPDAAGKSASDQDAVQALQMQDDIQREIDSIRARHAAYLQATADLRARAGESGLSQLTAIRTPFEAGLPLGYRGRVILTVIPTLLDAGAIDLGDPAVAYRFGSGQAVAGAPPDLQVGMRQTGTELRLGYQQGGFALDVGSTPLGFPEKTLTGGLRYRTESSGFGFAIDLSRRLVEDSVLSMAGVTDPVSGAVWGQVTRNGGRLDLGYTSQSTTYYLWGAYDVLIGNGVARNTEGSGGLGMEWGVIQSALADLGAGLSLTVLGYQYNLRYFTFGQGGYFSPAGFLNASVPLRLHGENGKLKWQAQVNVGLNWFSEDRSPYFPRNPTLQAAREMQTDATGAPLDAYYASQTTASFAFDATADLAYALSEHLDGGAFLRIHNAQDYDEVEGGIFLRLNFLGRAEPATPAASLVHKPWNTVSEQ